MFPEKIYYVATRKEQKAYYAKYSQKDSHGGSPISLASQEKLKAEVLTLQKQLQEQKRGFEKMEKQMADMKEMLERALATRS